MRFAGIHPASNATGSSVHLFFQAELGFPGNSTLNVGLRL
jgi:hypothetical protein